VHFFRGRKAPVAGRGWAHTKARRHEGRRERKHGGGCAAGIPFFRSSISLLLFSCLWASCQPQPAPHESRFPDEPRPPPPPRLLRVCPTSSLPRYTRPCAAPAPLPAHHEPVAPPPPPRRLGAAPQAPHVALPPRARRVAVTRTPPPCRLPVASRAAPVASAPKTRHRLNILNIRAPAGRPGTRFAPSRARPLARPFIPA
jgi:hypothetical protein